MEEKNLNQKKQEDLPEAQSIKKTDKKLANLAWVVIVLMFVSLFLEGAMGDIIRIITIILAVILITIQVKNRGHLFWWKK